LPAIASFCRQHTTDYFRFDPMLHLRFDGDEARNEEIRSERLSPQEVAAVEQADQERATSLRESCGRFIRPDYAQVDSDRLFHCAIGSGSFAVGYDGTFRMCDDLWHPDCVYDLRKGTLASAWNTLAPLLQSMRTTRREIVQGCRRCPIINLCMWCPAHAHLETGELDGFSDYFCSVAHARATALRQAVEEHPEPRVGA
jgi:radical SAM protein with 4Fe4S-binding SPASM domain